MAYPIWQTQGGDLGKISSQEYYELDLVAVDELYPETQVIPYLNRNLLHPDGHSKILGWSLDGYPIYGPYGYSISNDKTSSIKIMASSYGLDVSFRTAQFSTAQMLQYPAGIFIEDYVFLNNGDLDQHNGRFCVTPDYPAGTYAYFLTVDSLGRPVYPYSIGPTFYGEPVAAGANVDVDGKGDHPKEYIVSLLNGSTNFDGFAHSWRLDKGRIHLRARGIPYHTFGNSRATELPVVQNYDQIWPLRAGTNIRGSQPVVAEGIIGYMLNGVALFSPVAKINLPAGYTAPAITGYPGSLTLNSNYDNFVSLGISYFADNANGWADNKGHYHYSSYTWENSWENGTGGVYTSSGNSMNYSVISGILPPGIQLDLRRNTIKGIPSTSYFIDGVASSVSSDKTYTFTIRATNALQQISDKSFTLTITGNYPPQILTQTTILGNYLDCQYIDIPLSAIDLNIEDTVTWSLDLSVINQLNTGGLPPGLTLTSDGHIKGVILPVILSTPRESSGQTSGTGFGISQFNQNSLQFDPSINRKFYTFSVNVTDGKTVVRKQYQLNIYNSNDVRADNGSILASADFVTADHVNKRTPVFITQDMGVFGTVRSGEYFSYQFLGVDFDQEPIIYQLASVNGAGWDSDASYWDMELWESGDFSLPPGLYLDENTGWLIGKIPEQTQPSQTYSFGIQIAKKSNIAIHSAVRIFTVKVLGALDLAVNWITPANLGTLVTGSTSNIQFQATSPTGRQLYYYFRYDSRIPQGLKLLPSGELSGRVSFQMFNLDKQTTTFDVVNNKRGYLDDITTFDRTCKFTVIAQDYSKIISDEKTFTVRLTNKTYQPYENLYITCLPDSNKREILNKVLYDTDIFLPDDVYRSNDPYYGISKNIRCLTATGLSPAQAELYMQLMAKHHYNKTLYFGDFATAKAYDSNGNYIYDVIYVKMVETTRVKQIGNYSDESFNMPTVKSGWTNPRVADLPANQLSSDMTTLSDDTIAVRVNDTWRLIQRQDIAYVNDLFFMNNDIIFGTGITDLYALPEWMSSVQANGSILGFQLAAVLAYMKPGTGAKTLYNLNKNLPYDLKLIPFTADRYIWDNNLSINYDVLDQKWYNKTYTTFDGIINNFVITAKYTVDFALDTPFSILNELDIISLNDSGGLDSIVTTYNGKTVIFFTQELFTGYELLPDDGWDFPDHSLIPGYYEKTQGYSKTNQRAGVWKIVLGSKNISGWDADEAPWDKISLDKFDSSAGNQVITFVFQHEVDINDVVYVKEGEKHGKTYVQYTSNNMDSTGHLSPYYKTLNVDNNVSGHKPTTFDTSNTKFVNNSDEYLLPLENDTYLKWPRPNSLEPPLVVDTRILV